MVGFIFAIGIMTIFVTALCVAEAPSGRRMRIVAIGGSTLAAFVAWAGLFALFFGTRT